MHEEHDADGGEAWRWQTWWTSDSVFAWFAAAELAAECQCAAQYARRGTRGRSVGAHVAPRVLVARVFSHIVNLLYVAIKLIVCWYAPDNLKTDDRDALDGARWIVG